MSESAPAATSVQITAGVAETAVVTFGGAFVAAYVETQNLVVSLLSAAGAALAVLGYHAVSGNISSA